MSMGRCCWWGWLVRPLDTPEEARIKTIVIPFALFVFMISAFLVIRNLQATGQMVTIIANSINAFAMLQFILGIGSNAIPAAYHLDAMLTLCTLGICAQDLGTATRSSPFRSWAYVVLLLDISLVFKRYHMPRLLIPFVMVYLAVMQVESVSR
eukprot:Hpha_TRINITY_DN16272_c0_g4::TRINITY_DN16272_c0_g4_i1::g.12515::m.12515